MARPPRSPTDEERALWRAENRHTVVADLALGAYSDVEAMEAQPAPCMPESPYSPAVAAAKLEKPKATPAPLTPLSAREARALARRTAQATLDLHGMNKLDAYEAVQRFITQHHRRGDRVVCIITGKGRVGDGMLRRELAHWLNEPALRPLIGGFSPAGPAQGGEGAWWVRLKCKY